MSAFAAEKTPAARRACGMAGKGRSGCALASRSGAGAGMSALLAPFPYFGGKRSVTADVWERFGSPKQYIEPLCGLAAMLLVARCRAA